MLHIVCEASTGLGLLSHSVVQEVGLTEAATIGNDAFSLLLENNICNLARIHFIKINKVIIIGLWKCEVKFCTVHSILFDGVSFTKVLQFIEVIS